MGSMGLSLALELMGDEKKANFVGHWAPTFMSVGLALAQYEQTLENKKK